jgi:hypothetical protein
MNRVYTIKEFRKAGGSCWLEAEVSVMDDSAAFILAVKYSCDLWYLHGHAEECLIVLCTFFRENPYAVGNAPMVTICPH